MPVTFPVFHTHAAPRRRSRHGVVVPPSRRSAANAAIDLSPYARAYGLARRLAARPGRRMRS